MRVWRLRLPSVSSRVKRVLWYLCVVTVLVAVKVVFFPAAENEQHEVEARLQIPDPPPPTTGVIILTYQRSGSTFAGELFNRHPKSFYLFEPLWGIYRAMEKEKILNFPDKSMRHTPSWGMEKELLLQITDNLLNCRLKEVPMETLAPGRDESHSFFFNMDHRSMNLKRYRECLVSKKRPEEHQCVPILSKYCNHAKLVALKILRLRMEWLPPLLDKNPGLKVIHLVRDPRGSLFSRMSRRLNICDVNCEANVRCFHMARDLRWRRKMEAIYPGRLIELKYESYAEKPLMELNRIYNFLNIPVPPDVEDWVQENTDAFFERKGNYATTKENSSAAAHAWESRIPVAMAMDIDNVCADVLEDFGYRKASEILKDRITKEIKKEGMKVAAYSQKSEDKGNPQTAKPPKKHDVPSMDRHESAQRKVPKAHDNKSQFQNIHIRLKP
ncbi:carbohydrate sulfotransferase 3 isoform X1 [Lingula anatina]|uniref:Carbohydrate sulfotransferase 3 isoform X1 n=1 Tax=Lingula anatina TaxID=7574 RepID=A0A2R2MRL2_LINAN|nr:carbohydrate sulfotransferase 3 isoform X1 [Lingula anatina]|eukprot:XP_023932891.1 carbohydrate sulfotransferase 3 isoform X1 [Lingula anatina]